MKRYVIPWLAGKIKKRMAMLIIDSVAESAMALVGVAIALESKKLLDLATKGEAMANEFYVAAAILVGLIAVLLTLRILTLHWREKLLINLDRDWKAELLSKLMNGSFADVQKYHSGELVNRLSGDVEIVDKGIVSVVPGIASMVTKLIGASIVMFALEPVLTAVLLSAGILLIASTTALRKALKSLHAKVSASNGKVNGFIQEAMEKLLVVQAMDVSEEMDKRHRAYLDERANLQRKRKNLSILGSGGMTLAIYILYYGSLIICAIQLMRGEITIGTLTAVTQLVSQLQSPFTNLSTVINSYLSMKASAERLRELYDLPERAAVLDNEEELYSDMEAIVGKNLTFTYPGDEHPTLQNVNFVIPKGRMSAVTGESGIGKSTLLKLLLGIYAPDSGTILAGKTEISAATRRLFAYVPQGNLLISGTLRENLLLTSPDASEEEIRHALFLSGLDETVAEFPEGLETKIKETGAGISEGQAQRLSIARALLRNAPVLLLDEATSALDEPTEALVLDRLKKMENKTVVIVTHRPYARTIADGEIRLEA